GIAYGKLDRWNEAIEPFKQAIVIKPDYAEAHNNLGIAYGKLGRYAEGLEAHKKANGIDPNDAEVHNDLGDSLQPTWLLE
ncbi:MAG: tetratricopeptide repeat protein, partial [Planctomycetota bacterium]